MKLEEKLCDNIKGHILDALELEFMEAGIRIETDPAVTLTQDDLKDYDSLFSILDSDDLWIQLHEMNKQFHISDEMIFESYIDELIEQCMSNPGLPKYVTKISLYHVIPLSPDKWIQKLEAFQISDPKVPVDDSRWENEISSKMDSVIKTLDILCRKDRESDYRKAKKAVLDRFPRLRGKALEYLISAEVFYTKFEDEDALDYAPVLVEYCRCVETLLWEYIEASDIYRENGVRSQKFNDQGKTFGAAVYAIYKPEDGPLKEYWERFRHLKDLRNGSAHTFVTREPDVAQERKELWESDIIDILL